MQQLRSAIHNAIARFLKNQPPARIIAVGFALLILLGAALLMLPFAVHPGAHVGPLDALFTATSAVCVTGLVVVDPGATFSEVAGAALSFPSFARDHMPLQAVWLSIFHSIAAFNNAGFDALGGGQSLIPYQNDLLLNLVTDALVIVGGIGFMVILDVGRCRGQFRRMTFHTKVVLSTTAVLLVGGAVLLQLTDHMGWLAALFQSMTARTAGFSSVDLGSMSNAGLLVIMILMFIGASPGSTGGGIKTTTFFVLMQQVRSIFSKRRLGAFHRRLPDGSLSKAATIMLMGLMVVGCGTFALCVLEPQRDFGRLLFEQISAYSTAGLSTGITAELCPASRVVLILTMFIGRVGAVTLLSLWVERPAPSAQYTEENITIG